jgi:SSS family transporter
MPIALWISERPRLHWSDYAVLGVYLGVIVLMGVYLSGRNRSTSDFFLGSRSIPWWAAGLSIYGTQLSSITFMAMPAKTYDTDWTYILVNACILLVAPVLVAFYVPFFHNLNVTSAYEYLEQRFNRAVRLFSSALFIVFQLGRLSIVLFLPALALATVSDTNVYLCIALMGGLAILYTFLGGIQAVIWTDVLQAVVLLGGALVSLAIALMSVENPLSTAYNAGKLRLVDWSWDFTAATIWVMLPGNFASVLSTYTTDQAVIQKYLTTASARKAVQSIWTNAVMTVPSTLIFFGMGTALWVYYHTYPEKLNRGLANDAIFPWFIVQQLPAGVAGLVVAALFAAAQSTVSSSMHSMSTAIMVDFYQPARPRSTDIERLRLARWLTVILGGAGTTAALLMATYNIRSLYDTFLTLLSLLGGSVAGIFALGIFTRRANGPGVLIGAAISAALVFAVRALTSIHFFLYAAIGLTACVALGYLISFVFSKRTVNSLPAGAHQN